LNKANLDKLREEIRVMTNQTGLYRLLKDELSALGYWKNRKRGNPAKGYQKMIDTHQ